MKNLQKLQELYKLTNNPILLEYIEVLIQIELEYEE